MYLTELKHLYCNSTVKIIRLLKELYTFDKKSFRCLKKVISALYFYLKFQIFFLTWNLVFTKPNIMNVI